MYIPRQDGSCTIVCLRASVAPLQTRPARPTTLTTLRVYIHREGLCRLATEPYRSDAKSYGNRFIHLTNYSINRKSSRYEHGVARYVGTSPPVPPSPPNAPILISALIPPCSTPASLETGMYIRRRPGISAT